MSRTNEVNFVYDSQRQKYMLPNPGSEAEGILKEYNLEESRYQKTIKVTSLVAASAFTALFYPRANPFVLVAASILCGVGLSAVLVQGIVRRLSPHFYPKSCAN